MGQDVGDSGWVVALQSHDFGAGFEVVGGGGEGSSVVRLAGERVGGGGLGVGFDGAGRESAPYGVGVPHPLLGVGEGLPVGGAVPAE